MTGTTSGEGANGGQFHDPGPFTVEAQGQTLRFFPSGKARLGALLDLIGEARTSLKVCFYIFAKDTSSTRVRDALVAAAARGVKVTLIIDGFGADADDEFFAPLKEAGGHYCRFSARWTHRYLIRNHQKMVVVDEKRAMIGGFNVEDAYFDPPEVNGWHDLALIVEGSSVERLSLWYDRLHAWTSNPKANWRAIRRMLREWDAGEEPVQLLVGGPTRGLSSWAACVRNDLMEGAKLDMVMAYFSPPRRLLKRIGRIACKGETRLVMAAKSDNGATIGATRSLYSRLLKNDARIWEFEPCKLHMKLIVLDDAVYLGSANFDMRSLYLNLELMLRIEDAGLADRMREFVDLHLPASTEITPARHLKRATIGNRIRWWASWFLVTVVDYTVSRRLNLGL